MNSIIINGRKVEHQGVVDAIGPGQPFHVYDRTARCDAIVLHESAGLRPITRMLKHNWGCHFVVGKRGVTTQHADVGLACSHAPGMNMRAVGIEVVTPYYGPAVLPWGESIKAPWAHKRRGTPRLYAVPTLAQLEAVWQLVDVLTIASWDMVEIPREWPGVTKYGHHMSFSAGVWQRPGIVPHCHSIVPTRSDGPFISLYCLLRASTDLSPEDAREEAMLRALAKVAVITGGPT